MTTGVLVFTKYINRGSKELLTPLTKIFKHTEVPARMSLSENLSSQCQ